MQKVISKELFVNTINDIIQQLEIDEEFNLALDKYYESFAVVNGNNKIYSALLNLLENIFDDKDLINWWIYECRYFEYDSQYVKIDDTKHFVHTPEELYDVLVIQK